MFARTLLAIVLVVAHGLLNPSVALAGMPSIQLTDIARMRLQGISFFLMGLLISTVLIRAIWNRLQTDFTSLPRLTFGKAFGVVMLWGLLFVLVLTMISGTRELLTPGAWQKTDVTYKLKTTDEPRLEDDDLYSQRRQKLQQLRFALWDYARTHEGRFPPDRSDPAIPAETWSSLDASGMRFVYFPGRIAGQGNLPVALEPDLYGKGRLALYSSGQIRRAESDVPAATVANARP